MKQALSAFYCFLKSPHILKLSTDKRKLWRHFFSLMVFNYIFYGLLMAIYFILLKFKLIREYEDIDFFKEFGIPFTFICGCVLAPIIEEYLFRWHLRKRYASIYFILLAIAAILISNISNLYIKFAIFVICLGLAVAIHLFLRTKSLTLVVGVWRKSYPFIFYFSALYFGYLHISNIKGLTIYDPSFVLYISSQIMGGLTLGYLRLNYGLKYGILFHACYNLLSLGTFLLFYK